MNTFEYHVVSMTVKEKDIRHGHLLAINYSHRWPWNAYEVCECGGKPGTLGGLKLNEDIEPWSTVPRGCNHV